MSRTRRANPNKDTDTSQQTSQRLFEQTLTIEASEKSPISLSVESMAVLASEERIHVDDPEPLSHNARYCLCLPCFGGGRRASAVGLPWWERIGAVQRGDRWWARGLRAVRKLREWSEIVAGPKWKTFIRRLNRNRSGAGSAASAGHGKFQYDPLSYSLNFDEGSGHGGDFDGEDGFGGFRDFSARYAAVSGPLAAGGPALPVIAEARSNVAVFAS